MTETFNRENIQVGKVPSIFGGASLGFKNKNCWNHLQSIKLKELERGDQLLIIFKGCNERTLSSFMSFKLIKMEEQLIFFFFWVDARSRAAYEKFDNVVMFDTTYRTNKYVLLFAPFFGVNHHYQTIQFGCALL